jgi:type II secretory pathway component PulK
MMHGRSSRPMAGTRYGMALMVALIATSLATALAVLSTRQAIVRARQSERAIWVAQAEAVADAYARFAFARIDELTGGKTLEWSPILPASSGRKAVVTARVESSDSVRTVIVEARVPGDDPAAPLARRELRLPEE